MNSKNNCDIEKSFCGLNVIENNVLEGDLYENIIDSKKDKGVKLSEGVDNNMAIDNDSIEILLNQHGKQIDKCDLRITELERTTNKILIQNAEMSVKLSNIESNQVDTKKSILENSIALQNFQKELIDNQKDLFEKVLDNNNKMAITKEIGKNKICKQTIVTIGSIICALIASGFAYYQYSHPIVNKVINPTTSGVIEKVIK